MDEDVPVTVDLEDEGKENIMLLNPNHKRFCGGLTSPKMRHLLSFITLSRIKTTVVTLVLIVMIFLFSTEGEEGVGINLKAVTANHPMIEGDSPLDIIEVEILIEQYPIDMEEDIITVDVSLEQIQDISGRPWVSIFNKTLQLSSLTETEAKFRFDVFDESPLNSYRFNVATNSDIPIGFTFNWKNLPAAVVYEVVFAATILFGVYVLIVFELVHRTIAALLGSFFALAILSKIHSRPTLTTVVSWIDYETCGLLFGMMVMVGIFSQTGFFEWVAVKAYKMSKGNIWKLIMILCVFTAVVSAFLDNVTTILLLTPVTIRLCKVLEIPPQQILIALVMYSNIGGTATAVGDPPNIIIVNDARVKASGVVDFFTFSLHIGPAVILASFASYFVIRYLSKHLLQREPNMGKKKEIEIWRRTAKKLSDSTEEEKAVRQKLEEYIEGLEKEVDEQPAKPLMDVEEMERKYPIRDMGLFINSCVVLTVVIILFFLHSMVNLHLSLAWIAIIGAMAHLLISGIRDVDEVLEKVEFGTLLFFAGLFILMRALEELGLIDFIGDRTSELIAQVPEGQGRLAVAVVLILWISGLVSAFIDNIPYTAAMVHVVVGLGTGDLGLPLAPLLWALALGTCFGGNGTLIGASANVVAAGISESQGYPIRFNTFFRTGFPVMIVTLITSTVYLLVSHVWIPWY